LNKRIPAILFAGFLTVAIAFSIRYAYGMLLPEMLPALDINKTQAGAVFTVYFIIYTVFTPVLGVLSDYCSYRTILSVFTAILATGALAMAYTDSLVQTILFFSIAAFGHAACWAPVMVLVQKWVPDERRGAALSFVSMGVGTGIFTWGLLIPVIVSHSGWRWGWTWLGITGLIVAMLNLILVKNPEKNAPVKQTFRVGVKAFLASYRDIFKQTTFWLIGFAYLLVGFNVIIQFTFLPVYARESLGVAYAVSTRFISVIAFFGVIGQMSLGPLSDKIGRIRVMIWCSITLGLSSMGIVLFRETWTLYLFTAIYGVGYGAIWPLYAAVAPDLFSRDHSGGVIGLWTVFLGIGSMAGPVLSGWIVDTTGSYTGVFISSMSAGLISVVLLMVTHVKIRRKTKAT
jgi:MFS family permease